MNNPWKKNGRPNFYFEEDAIIIKKFNDDLKNENSPFYIDLKLMPEPYLGDPNANVILLFTNPGLKGNEEDNYDNIPGFKDAVIKNLTHENHDCPYFYLNKDFKNTDGGVWIRKRVKRLLDKSLSIEDGYEKLSKQIFSLQLHPYHSKKYRKVKAELKGHKYTMSLLDDAIKRKAIIICTRSYPEWNSAYKEFANTKESLKNIIGTNFIELKTTPLTPYFIPSYFINDNYEQLIAKLK